MKRAALTDEGTLRVPKRMAKNSSSTPAYSVPPLTENISELKRADGGEDVQDLANATQTKKTGRSLHQPTIRQRGRREPRREPTRARAVAAAGASTPPANVPGGARPSLQLFCKPVSDLQRIF